MRSRLRVVCEKRRPDLFCCYRFRSMTADVRFFCFADVDATALSPFVDREYKLAEMETRFKKGVRQARAESPHRVTGGRLSNRANEMATTARDARQLLLISANKRQPEAGGCSYARCLQAFEQCSGVGRPRRWGIVSKSEKMRFSPSATSYVFIASATSHGQLRRFTSRLPVLALPPFLAWRGNLALRRGHPEDQSF